MCGVLLLLLLVVASASILEETTEVTEWPTFMEGTGLSGCLFAKPGPLFADYDDDGFQDALIFGRMSLCGRICSASPYGVIFMFRGGAGGNDFRFSIPAEQALDPADVPVDMREVALMNVDADGSPDFVLSSSNNVIVARSERNGSFALVLRGDREFAVKDAGHMVTPVDLDDSGYDDFMLFSYETTSLVLRSAVFGNMHNSSFVDVTVERFGSIAAMPSMNYVAALISDLNGDSRLDMILFGGSILPRRYIQNATGVLVRTVADPAGLTTAFWFPRAAASDFNADGVMDIFVTDLMGVAGVRTFAYIGLGGGDYFERRLPAPLDTENIRGFGLYVRDIDHNGFDDVILCGNEADINRRFAYLLWNSGNSFTLEPLLNYTTVGNGPSWSASFAAGEYEFVMLSDPRQEPQNIVSLLFEGTQSFAQPDAFRPELSFIDVFFSMSSLADFTGDGCADIAFCGKTSALLGACNIMYGNCDGSFSRSSYGNIGPSVRGMAQWAMLDADDKFDLFIVGEQDATPQLVMQLYLGTELSLDVAPVHIPDTAFERPVGSYWLAADVDADGAGDYLQVSSVTGISNPASVLLLHNAGNATFSLVWDALAGAPFTVTTMGAFDAMVGDLYDDGVALPALYLANPNEPGSVWRNYGNLTFARDPAKIVGAPVSPFLTGHGIAEDFDGDGRTDMLMLDSINIFVAFAHENGSLVVEPRSAVAMPNVDEPKSVGIALFDFDSDGVMEVVLTGSTTVGAIALALRGVPGHMLNSTPDAFPPGTAWGSSSVASGDLYGDSSKGLVVLGESVYGCRGAGVYVRPRSPSAALTSTTAGAASTGSLPGDTPIGAVVGSVLGGGVLLLALAGLGLLCVCCLVCLVCFVAGVALVAVVGVVAAVVVVVFGAGIGASGAGGGAAVLLSRQHGGSTDFVVEELPAESLEEIQRRMKVTTAYRQISWDEFVFEHKIGEGAYGTVYAGEWQGARVAVKVIHGTLTPQALADFEHEALMMAKVSHHPHIVQFIGASVETERLAMVLRFCDGGSLDTALWNGRLGSAEKLRVVAEVAGALAFLHSVGVIHRDVAARNVLLDGSGSSKLSDLGLSRLIEDSAGEQATKSMVGPVRWMAPEAMTEQRYSGASDAWSFGVLMWEVWSNGATPYEEMKSVADVATAVVREGKRLRPPATCPPEHASIIRRLLVTDPVERPSMQDVYQQLARVSPTNDSAELFGAQADASDEYFAAGEMVQDNADEYVEADDLI